MKAALVVAAALSLGCAGFFRAPDGVRPSSFTVWAETGQSRGTSFGDEFSSDDDRVGVSFEFEWVYDEAYVEEEEPPVDMGPQSWRRPPPRPTKKCPCPHDPKKRCPCSEAATG